MTAPAPPASTSEALGMLTSAMSYLATAEATQMPAQVQAQCLMTLEQADAMETAARASILAAFTASQGYHDDADYSPCSWLIHQTRVTSGTAKEHVGWSRRPPRRSPSPTPGPSAAGPTGCPRTAGTAPMRSCSAPR